MTRNRLVFGVASAAVPLMILTGCGGGDGADSSAEDGNDMEALIAAAQEEGELVAYWHSGRIEAAGEAFEEEYGITVTGTKSSDSETTERIIREVESENVLADVIGYDDGSRLANELIPNEIVSNYVPPAYEDQIDPEYADPLVYLFQVTVWGYNTETYPDGCPVSNIWELTEPEWNQNIQMLDPRMRSTQLQWFAEMEENADALESAYEDHYGEPLETAEDNAALEFIKRLAENQPTLRQGDEDIAAAAGVRGQENPPLGQYALARHRENEELNHALAYCELEPFTAFNQPSYVSIVEGANNPNAARLFINFLMTEEGIAPWTDDPGGYSVIPELTSHPDNPHETLDAWGDSILNLTEVENVSTRRGELLDFWTQVND